jgi:N-acetylmuramoyl-L-alanine amidase
MQAGFWVLVAASMPSVLVESGYISDENDANYLTSGIGQINIAKALFEGFNTYKMLYESN